MLSVIAAFWSITTACVRAESTVRTVRISGRLVVPDGHPAVTESIGIVRITSDGFKDYRQTLSGTDGRFVFTVARGYQYRIATVLGKTTRKTVDTRTGKDVDLGDLTFERCPPAPIRQRHPPSKDLSGNLKPEQIVIDKPGDIPTRISFPPSGRNRLYEPPLCWSGPSLDRRWEWEDAGGVSFAQYLSVESFAGGKVKLLKVTRTSSQLTQEQIRKEVRKVWLGVFFDAAAQIGWSEASFWNVEASIEFEDGRKGLLLTDGGHVCIQDHDGRRWFMRLWPAVD